MNNTIEVKFRAAVDRIDQRRLSRNFDDLRAALRRSTGSWHVVEATVTRMKVSQLIAKSEETMLLAILRHAAREAILGLRVSKLFLRTLKASGTLAVVTENAVDLAPLIQMKSLPLLDGLELRSAGLTDAEIVLLIQSGTREYRTNIASNNSVDLPLRRFSHLDARLRRLEAADIRAWRRDILEGESGWKVFYGGVKVLAGACITAADLLGAVETVGATIISVASGVGLMASGAQDMEELLD